MTPPEREGPPPGSGEPAEPGEPVESQDPIDHTEQVDGDPAAPRADSGGRASRSGFSEEFEAALANDFETPFEKELLEDEEELDEDEELADEAEMSVANSQHDRLAQETVEADVLALGDAEEAAEQAAAAGAGAPEIAEEPGEEQEPEDSRPEAEPEQTDEEEDKEDTEDTAVAAPVGAAVATKPAPPPGPGEPSAPAAEAAPEEDGKPPKSRLWLRFLAASFVIVMSMATATAVTGLLYLTDIAKGLGGIEGVRKQLTQVEGGEPETILILGSDRRPGEHLGARSDTTMLLRLDPNQDAIALFSLPRDLKVNIPGYGVDRLNAAYSEGGPKLTLKTVQQLTGLDVNHVVNVDFEGFVRAVNAIDCVYVDVDRRYYVPPDAGYAEIDVEAGYQQLCGEKALQYVRFRHTDTDLTRSARQQDFLREARQKIGPGRLFRDRDELIKIFTRYTTSDIEDPETMLEVLKLFLSVADSPVKEIHFEGNLGPSYVTFSQEEMQDAVDEFIGIEDTEGPRGGGASSGGGGGGGGGHQNKPEEPELIDSSERGRQLAERFARSTKFPVFYPTKLTPGAQFGADSRTYEIADEDGKVHDIYKFVIQTTLLGEYYGVSGTSWEDPPILDNPSETREIGDREYDLFYDGDRLRMVAWHTDEGSYWLTNTLLQSVDEDQMLEIAENMEDVEPPK